MEEGRGWFGGFGEVTGDDGEEVVFRGHCGRLGRGKLSRRVSACMSCYSFVWESFSSVTQKMR